MFNKFFKWIQLKFFFKMKKSLPESPSQEISTSSNQSDTVLQSLEVKDKQEQMKFFEKKNDLRDVVFDLNPIWDNHQVYGEGTGEDDGWKPAEIRAVKGYEEPVYKDEVQDYSNPWNDIKKFPRKNYQLSNEELDKLKLAEDVPGIGGKSFKIKLTDYDTKTYDKSEDHKDS